MELIGVLVGVILGFLLSFLGTWWRDKCQAEADRRLLAGALAAELRGFLGLWKHVVSDESQSTWSVEQDYFPVYDSAGHRLCLLKRDVLQEVVTCYSTVKKAVDMLRRSQRLWDQVSLMPRLEAKEHQPKLAGAATAAVSAGKEADEAVNQVLPKLDELAA